MDTEPETTGSIHNRPVFTSSAMKRARFMAQHRAERLWHLQRQVSEREWATFVRDHPEYHGWYHWIPTRSR